MISNNLFAAVSIPTYQVTGHPPTVEPKLNKKELEVGDSITVNEEFSDPDQDIEDKSTTGTRFQWQKEDPIGSGQYINIENQTKETYIPSYKENRRNIRVKVTPRTNEAITEPAQGEAKLSDIALVIMTPSAIESKLSLITTLSNSTIEADDGTSQEINTKAKVILNLRDKNNSPIIGERVTFKTDPSESRIKITSTIEQGDGMYASTITGTLIGQYKIYALVNGKRFGSGILSLNPELKIIPAKIDPQKTVYQTIAGIPPDAVESAVGLQFTVMDKFNNVITLDPKLVTVESVFSKTKISSGHGPYDKPTIQLNFDASKESIKRQFIGVTPKIFIGTTELPPSPIPLSIVPRIVSMKVSNGIITSYIKLKDNGSIKLPQIGMDIINLTPIDPVTKQGIITTACGSRGCTRPVTTEILSITYPGSNAKQSIDIQADKNERTYTEKLTKDMEIKYLANYFGKVNNCSIPPESGVYSDNTSSCSISLKKEEDKNYWRLIDSSLLIKQKSSRVMHVTSVKKDSNSYAYIVTTAGEGSVAQTLNSGSKMLTKPILEYSKMLDMPDGILPGPM